MNGQRVVVSLFDTHVPAYIQERALRIIAVASRGRLDGERIVVADDSMPAVVVVIGRDVDRDSIRTFGGKRLGDVVEMPAQVIRTISEHDANFAQWARRIDGVIRIFYVEGQGSLLLNLIHDGTALRLWLEPGSTDAEHEAAAS